MHWISWHGCSNWPMTTSATTRTPSTGPGWRPRLNERFSSNDAPCCGTRGYVDGGTHTIHHRPARLYPVPPITLGSDIPIEPPSTTAPSMVAKERALANLQQSLTLATHSGLFDDMAATTHPDVIKEILQNLSLCLVHVSRQWHPHRL